MDRPASFWHRFNFTWFMWSLPASFEFTMHGAYIQVLCLSILIGEPF
jgi:hypothetical protein